MTGFEGWSDDHATDEAARYSDKPPFAGITENNVEEEKIKTPSGAATPTNFPPVSNRGPG